jgi:6-pyruvoyltetrahydropterin/6-carboxytetrahydropterin synthase
MKEVIKTYGHDRGYSAIFRQPKANSHCRFIHGYALAFTFTFACEDDEVDENGWVIDFGGLKPLKAYLDDHFDHKFLVAQDDPALELFMDMSEPKKVAGQLVDVRVVQATGCENFAKHLYDVVQEMLLRGELGATQAQIVSVEVREHGANGGRYIGNYVTAAG